MTDHDEKIRLEKLTDEQKAAYVNSQVACAMIEAAGMTALNMQRQALGNSMAYNDEAFFALIEKYRIHHHAVLGSLAP